MNVDPNSCNQTPDPRLRYVLLAMEAEQLSERATSTYLREACMRLCRFWTAQAEDVRDDGNMTQKFEAPRRPTHP